MKRFIFSILFIWQFQFAIAQNIESGPVIGAVTDSSARMYCRTINPVNLLIELDSDTLFGNAKTYSVSTSDDNYRVVVVDLEGLRDQTKYYYRIKIDNVIDSIKGSFRTFPKVNRRGYYKVVVGSCNYHDFEAGGGATSPDNYYNDVLFGGIKKFDPAIVLHLGDWNYPPSRFGSNHLSNPGLGAESFAFRYSDYNMSNYITPYLPLDYIYDDDFSFNGNAGWTWPSISPETLSNGSIKYVLEDIPIQEGVREGAIEAYFKNFPGYKQVDTSGIHHSFKLGHIEFFVVDTRSSKSDVLEAFRYNSFLNLYEWRPNGDRTTLGEIQREWLINGLKNSDADWKVICSSVVFNKRMGELIPLVLAGQLIDRSLVEFASAMAYMWGGYPKDLNAVLKTIREDSIKNVIVLSGDTHSSMMDDGKNAGLPELSSSGWAAGNEGYLNYTIDSIIQLVSLPISVKDFLWNSGGSGIGNSNFSDTYSTIEFFYSDSVRMCVKDEFDQTLSCMTIGFKGTPNSWIDTTNQDTTTTDTITTFSPIQQQQFFTLLYPNPTRQMIHLLFKKNHVVDNADRIDLITLDGKVVKVFTVKELQEQPLRIDVSELPSGKYFIVYQSKQKSDIRSFVKH